ncbi:MAG: ribonuclease H-like domain-containing protein [Lachnospiraceae bacterium]|nr:ribonuclease H-like domain-containing protein [Lachnospiraceae bacterium]
MTESYVCIDLETTGLNPRRDKIIEIGAVKVENNRIVEKWETFINPNRKLEERISALTGICDEQLSKAPVIEEALPKLLALTENNILLGHRVLFDYSFIKKAAVDGKLSFERNGIDTLKIARKYLINLESRSLGYLCSYYNISHNAHRALGDAEATVELYQRLTEEFYEQEKAEGNRSLFVPKALTYHVKRDTPITVSQKEQLYKLRDRHKLIIDYDIERLSRSEASRRIDLLLAEFGR